MMIPMPMPIIMSGEAGESIWSVLPYIIIILAYVASFIVLGVLHVIDKRKERGTYKGKWCKNCTHCYKPGGELYAPDDRKCKITGHYIFDWSEYHKHCKDYKSRWKNERL